MLTWTLSLMLLAAPPAAAKAPKAETKKDETKKDEGDAPKAKELFKAAQKLYQAKKYAEAIARFEESYAAKPYPVIFYNIGRCWEQLEETAKALRAYKDYLHLMPDAKDKATVAESISSLESKLKEKGLQQVVVYAEPSSARVEIDGKDLGTVPVSVELVAGTHRLAVKAGGFEAIDRTFVVAAGRSSDFSLTLVAAKASAQPPPPPPPPLVDATKKDPKDAPKAVVLTPTKTDSTTVGAPISPVTPKKGRLFTWIAGGTAVAAGGAGAVMGFMANDASNTLRDPKAAPRTRAQNDGYVSTATGMATGANVAFAVAGTAAVTALVMFFVEGR